MLPFVKPGLFEDVMNTRLNGGNLSENIDTLKSTTIDDDNGEFICYYQWGVYYRKDTNNLGISVLRFIC